MRTLLILIAVAVIVLGIKRLLAKPRAGSAAPARSGKMVPCAHCGMFIPETDAIHRRGRHYCSEEHRDADPD
jgi:uncharacterized protein